MKSPDHGLVTLKFAAAKPRYKGTIDWYKLWDDFDAYYTKRYGNYYALDDNKKRKIKNLINKQLKDKK